MLGHLEANGQAEVTNKTLLSALKKLGVHKRAWADELLGVLWAYRTTVWTPTRETPFTFTYGRKAVILAEVGMPMYCIEHFDATTKNERLAEEPDLLEERREMVSMRIVSNETKARAVL